MCSMNKNTAMFPIVSFPSALIETTQTSFHESIFRMCAQVPSQYGEHTPVSNYFVSNCSRLPRPDQNLYPYRGTCLFRELGHSGDDRHHLGNAIPLEKSRTTEDDGEGVPNRFRPMFTRNLGRADVSAKEGLTS